MTAPANAASQGLPPPLSPDVRLMRAAIAYAARGLGQTAPNPSVAALVVSPNGVIVGRGLTAKGGRPHAEALALKAAGEAARDATLYVTLEPCATRSSRDYGASCADLIAASGIARVVIAAADPSPFASGQGAQLLKSRGVEVVEGVLAQEASDLNQGHILRVQAQRPFIQVKIAQTTDGFAGTTDGTPLQITGEEARAFVHRLRGQADALITGIGTILADNPRLNVRLPGMAAHTPLRVIADTFGRTPVDARLLQEAHVGGIIIATASPEAVMAKFKRDLNMPSGQMPEILAIPQGADGHLDLTLLISALCARGVTRVMIEAGPRLSEAFVAAGLCDELVVLTGPTSLVDGTRAMGEALSAILVNRAEWQHTQSASIGADTLNRYKRIA